ncbi:MAG: DUF1972 domain-containing protein [Lachnospiraceae bacterium]|nr:DUF1972 domain-containing protein [Lachnospiraceae bacterium]
MKHVFIIGSKGIPASYGGFESFVDALVTGKKSEEIKYHVACMGDEDREGEYNGAHTFTLRVPQIGPAKAVWYDIAAYRYCLSYIKKHNISSPIIYILACRIGPFVGALNSKMRKLGGKVYVNPDGHEWLRAKWNKAIRRYWRFSEKLMVKNADLLICDSKNIEKYIRDTYRAYKPNTCFIAYGAEVPEETNDRETENKYADWCKEKGIEEKEYYLIVGRFVPENNYETMIKEFMKSKTTKNLAIVTNVEENEFYRNLKEKTGFDRDERIKFVGTVYDKELLSAIRRGAFAYIHGHEVGGTNPSLLEALASTDLNILLDVGFNREVGENAAVYFDKTAGNLASVIENADLLGESEIADYGARARKRISEAYSVDYINDSYEKVFLS